MVMFRENELKKTLLSAPDGNWAHDLPHTNHWATENSSNEQVIRGLT